MNGADVVLQDLAPQKYHETGFLAISSFVGPLIFEGLGKDLLVLIERFGWWLHIIVVFAFINYIPRSKHLHIILAFPNVFFAKLTPRGAMENMPVIENEVRSMMGLQSGNQDVPVESTEEADLDFGVQDVFDLSWKNLLDAYSCTECGRCTSVCPANITGKKLSPRKIVMNIRDRAEEVAKNLDTNAMKFIRSNERGPNATLTKSNYDDGANLFSLISREEIHACTACYACVEACPILINPLEPILQMRRYEILTESKGPAEWIPMFNSLESSGSVWQTPDDRDNWTKEIIEK